MKFNSLLTCCNLSVDRYFATTENPHAPVKRLDPQDEESEGEDQDGEDGDEEGGSGFKDMVGMGRGLLQSKFGMDTSKKGLIKGGLITLGTAAAGFAGYKALRNTDIGNKFLDSARGTAKNGFIFTPDPSIMYTSRDDKGNLMKDSMSYKANNWIQDKKNSIKNYAADPNNPMSGLVQWGINANNSISNFADKNRGLLYKTNAVAGFFPKAQQIYGMMKTMNMSEDSTIIKETDGNYPLANHEVSLMRRLGRVNIKDLDKNSRSGVLARVASAGVV